MARTVDGRRAAGDVTRGLRRRAEAAMTARRCSGLRLGRWRAAQRPRDGCEQVVGSSRSSAGARTCRWPRSTAARTRVPGSAWSRRPGRRAWRRPAGRAARRPGSTYQRDEVFTGGRVPSSPAASVKDVRQPPRGTGGRGARQPGRVGSTCSLRTWPCAGHREPQDAGLPHRRSAGRSQHHAPALRCR